MVPHRLVPGRRVPPLAARALPVASLAPLLLPLLVGAGCKDGGGGGDDDDDDGVPSTTAPEPSSTLALVDAWNLTYTATPDLPVFTVSPGTDFEVDLTGLTTDVWGRPTDPSAWQNLLLSELAVDPATAAASVAQRGPTPDLAVETWGRDAAGVDRAPASSFSHTGHAFPADRVEAGKAYLVTLQDPDLAMISAAIVTVGGGADTVALGAARITATLALDADGPVTTAALAPWTLDWSALTTSSWGDPLDPLALETLFVARWDDEAAVDLLEPATADGYWAKYVPGDTSLDPETMNGFDGRPFPGFEPGPTWIVGFRCVNCQTPVPQYATRVTVLP